MPRASLRIPYFRYLIAAMLFLATMINYLDRQAIAVVSRDLRQEFGLTEQDYGHIIFFFMLAYAIMYAASGPIIDRLGTRRGFAACITFWSAAAMSHALARGKRSLIACRFLLGMGEPGNWPAAAKAVAEWFPANQRALGVGIFNAGSSIGSAISSPVVAWLTIHYGWRSAFVWTGSVGFAWLVLWLILYQPPHLSRWITLREWNFLRDQVRPPQDTVAQPLPPGDWLRILRRRECWTLILARFFTDPVIYFIIFWLPEYLRKERHYDLASVGKYAWVPFIFGDIGYMFGGWFSGYLMRRGWTLPRARKLVLIGGAAVMPAGIFATWVPDAASAIALTCCMTFGHALWVSNLLTLPTDLFPGRQVATASGFTGMGGAIGGMLANLTTGYVAQRFSYRPIFTMAGLMHPLSLCLVLWLLPDRRFAAASAALTPAPVSETAGPGSADAGPPGAS